MIPRFPPKVSESLKHYVYLYIDPRTDQPFYVGKGKGNRVFSHLDDTSETEKATRISELQKLGLEPKIEILKYGLSEKQALLVESTAIDLLGIKTLTNRMRGHGASKGGRGTLDQIIGELGATDVTIEERVVLITINKLFRHGMTSQELYDTTRGIWRARPEKHVPDYAFSVYAGVVREVYRICDWYPAGSTFMSTRDLSGRESLTKRWEFIGQIAPEEVRRRYKGKSVRQYLGSQNPIRYVNCDNG